uniref:Uncharacterized protein n=1 Tax=Wuchereria bancrofti TaxID=6293 RepID=A0AAF5RWL1_WUCBA
MEDEKCNFLSALPFSGTLAVMNEQTYQCDGRTD